jgi:Tfp pilus assembly protein PilN
VLRTNLSTRPFYNERAVHVVLALLALLVLAATVFDVTRIVRLSRQNTELSARAARDQAEAERLGREAMAVRRAIDKDELQLVAYAAQEANALIDHRTFSWTAFFNYIEATLPPDVMLVAVRPSVEHEQTRVTMTVLSRRAEDIHEFIEKLEATGAFEDVIPAQGDPTKEGLQRAVLEGVYTGAGAEPDAVDAASEPVPEPGSAKPGAGNPSAAPPPAGGKR